MRQYLIGVDGGASRSRGILVDGAGRQISSAVGDGLNPLSLDWENFAHHFEALLSRLLTEVSPDEVKALCAGLAGVGSDVVRDRVKDEITAHLPEAEIHVITDAHAALWSAFQGGAGLLLIAGTGSICLGMDAQGKTARSGGFGRLLGDEGSGYWIALQAVKEALQMADKGAKTSSLALAICSEYDLTNLLQVVPLFHGSEMTAARMAHLTERILALSSADRAANRIVRNAGEHLAAFVVNTAQKLKLIEPRMALWGGLWNSPGKELQSQLEVALRKKRFGCEIVAATQPPEWGAIYYLRKQLA